MLQETDGRDLTQFGASQSTLAVRVSRRPLSVWLTVLAGLVVGLLVAILWSAEVVDKTPTLGSAGSLIFSWKEML